MPGPCAPTDSKETEAAHTGGDGPWSSDPRREYDRWNEAIADYFFLSGRFQDRPVYLSSSGDAHHQRMPSS